MENNERNCEQCPYSKPLYRDGELIGISCSRWDCIEESKDEVQ